MTSVFRRLKTFATRIVWCVMAFSALLTMFSTTTFPIIKTSMLQYEMPINDCAIQDCNQPGVCVINGRILGSDFRNVNDFYTLPIFSLSFFVNFFLLMRIFGSRMINVRCSTFIFFCLIVFPVRFLFLAMQTMEFTEIGGDYYTLFLLDPSQYNCEFFGKDVDAMFFMNMRIFILLVDFITFHILLVCVPFFYAHDKLSEKEIIIKHEELDRYTQAAAILLNEKV